MGLGVWAYLLRRVSLLEGGAIFCRQKLEMPGAVLATLSTGSFVCEEVGKSCCCVPDVAKGPKAKPQKIQALAEASTIGQEC